MMLLFKTKMLMKAFKNKEVRVGDKNNNLNLENSKLY